jgi:hypothetical protein
MSRLRTVIASVWFKLALSAALITVLFVETDFGQLGTALATVHPGWLLLGLLTYLLSQAMSALRWCVLARPLGFTQPFARFFTWYFSGMYLNLFAPSTVAGDVWRALFLAGGKGRRALALTSVIADRGIGFAVIVWIAAAAILLLPGYPLPRPLYWAAWLVPPLTAIAWWAGPLLLVRFFAPGNRWRLMVEHDLAPYRRDHRLLSASVLLACVFHLLQIGSQIAIAWALRLPVAWTFFLIFVPVVNIAGMLPITLSGIGVREAGYVYFLALTHVEREPAIALGLVSSAVVLLTGLTGAPMFLLLPPRARASGEQA